MKQHSCIYLHLFGSTVSSRQLSISSLMQSNLLEMSRNVTTWFSHTDGNVNVLRTTMVQWNKRIVTPTVKCSAMRSPSLRPSLHSHSPRPQIPLCVNHQKLAAHIHQQTANNALARYTHTTRIANAAAASLHLTLSVWPTNCLSHRTHTTTTRRIASRHHHHFDRLSLSLDATCVCL